MVSKKNTLMPIKVKKLNFEKGQRKLLTDISCEIKAKGITIILGPNGAGKTLFLKFTAFIELFEISSRFKVSLLFGLSRIFLTPFIVMPWSLRRNFIFFKISIVF